MKSVFLICRDKDLVVLTREGRMKSIDTSKNYDGVAIGTLALGNQFVMHAILLANDLLTYHPNSKFFVLTDRPEIFSGFKNVVAISHQFAGVRRCYHDKRFVIKKMLQLSDSCLFLDADSRLLGEIDFGELLAEGAFITCLHSKNLQIKLHLDVELPEKKARRRSKILIDLAEKLGVDFSNVTFVQEPLLVFQSRYGDINRFFAAWDFCAAYTAMRFFEFSEGSSIGLSVEMINAKISTLGKNPHWLFKDQLEDYTYKSTHEIIMSRQLIITRHAIDANYQAATFFPFKIPVYIFRYCKNIRRYIDSKIKLQRFFS